MQRTSFPFLTIAVLILGVLAVIQPTQPIEHTDPVNGCGWDRDTLANEASGFPGITEIITGRFERPPALFYEMRLERVARELQTDPDNLGLYDDACVACDRLNRQDEAILWMEGKRAALDRLAANGTPDADHEYRYLANLGTVYIHRWLKNGANREDLGDVEQAYDLIEAAIELNPDAHFGRERYQLLAIKWIRDGFPHPEYGYRQPTMLEVMDGYEPGQGLFVLDDLGYGDAAEGFSGLIALGNAWESVDIFYALSLVFRDQSHGSLNLLAQKRVGELVQAGKRSLSPEFEYDDEYQNFMEGDVLVDIHDPYVDKLSDEYYPKARKEADDWVKSRNDYALERLQRGEHPDTHPEFWGQWTETSSPPQMPGRPDMLILPGAIISVLGIMALIALLILRLMYKGIRKSRRSAPA
tara:strand:+ start:327548 stop:328786 length:1239 start_codon:yes stop_codon:yes gene_type:complete